MIFARQKSLELSTRGESFHALTVIEGQAKIVVDGQDTLLNRFETALVPAACGAYQLHPLESCRVLKAAV
jgi:mannose-6-phosphate isomerase